MIVVDASAVVAILNEEAGYQGIAARLLLSDQRRISPVSYVEVIMALARQYPAPQSVVENYLERIQVRIHPIDTDQARWAQHAFLTYGKGRHPAKLNLGDCFSYAAAKSLNAPLLYVGSDFAQTDIKAA